MGFSKVAELNQHPGPKHVLELTEELELTESQREQVERAFQEMKARVQDLGLELVEKEQRLDSTFASGSAGEVETEALLQEIGELRAQLRFAHVQAHMRTKEVLTPNQVEQYDELRGYDGSRNSQEQHDDHDHGA